MSGHLLGREVTADDVAQAFLHHALALKTTAGRHHRRRRQHRRGDALKPGLGVPSGPRPATLAIASKNYGS